MNDLISIIVPVYNTEKYLPECIESLINQTYKNIEIILVNDGSTDNSYKICREYAEKDRRIKVINKLNGGVSSARKIGILNALGGYVGFVDSDDYVSEKMYETMFLHIKEDIDAVINLGYSKIFNCEIIKENDVFIPEGIYDIDNIDIEIYKKILFKKASLCLGLWKKDKFISYIMEVDEKIFYCEDALIFRQFIVNASKICIIQKNIYYYRKLNFNSLTTSKNSNYLYSLHCYYNSLKKYFGSHKNSKIIIPQLEKNVFNMLISAPDFLFESSVSASFYIFPYEKIHAGSKVILYGIGKVGKSYYRQICKNNYCNIVMLADKNYEQVHIENVNICNPSIIKEIEYDYVLIANKNSATSEKIAQNLSEKYGVNKEKIICHKPIMLSDIIFD